MPKPTTRPSSQYSRNALLLLGTLIRESRIEKSMTTMDLAARAGISRSLLLRIEQGDPGCSIGAVFETAAICGVPLFEQDQRSLAAQLQNHSEKLTLLPKAVKAGKKAVKDDF